MAATFTVQVAPGFAFVFSPSSVTIQPGDTVTWVWEDSLHSVTAGTPGHPHRLIRLRDLKSGVYLPIHFLESGNG